MMNIHKSLATTWMLIVFAGTATANEGDQAKGTFGALNMPAYADSWNGFEGSVEFREPVSGKKTVFRGRFEYSNGESGALAFEGGSEVKSESADAVNVSLISFKVPPPAEPMLGTIRVVLELVDEVVRGESDGLIEATIPVAYVEEVDVTGNPPVELLYPLGDESHLVRYIPCCNIFGGVLNVKRIPVNPTHTDEGLPEARFSDFVVLEPDSLVESTAGLHMRFTYDAEAVKAAGVEAIAPYIFLGEKWDPLHTFEHDADAATIYFLYPDGGLFVLAAVPTE